jgi:hypothetical protein
MPISKMENKKTKWVLYGDWYQWEGGRYKKRVKEAEYSGNIMHSCMNGKMRSVESIPGVRGEENNEE